MSGNVNSNGKGRKSRLRSRIIWALKLCVSAGITGFIVMKIMRGQNLDHIKQMLAQLPVVMFVVWMAGAFLVKGSGMFMAIVRWRLLLIGQGYHIGWRHLIGSFLIGRFIGSFTPSTTGLDGWRLYDIARHAKNTAASVSVILVEKITGFFILSVLLLATIPLGGTIIQDPLRRAAFEKGSTIAVLVLGIPMAVAFMMILRPALIRRVIQGLSRFTGRFAGKFMKFSDALGAYEKQKGLLLYALGAGFLVHLAQCFMYYFTGNALGLPVTLRTVLFIGPIEIAATIVPLSIAGIGVRELVWAVLIGSQLGGGDVGFASGALMGFLGYSVGEGISLFGGPIWLTRRADYRMMKELEQASPDRIGESVSGEVPKAREEGEVVSAAGL